MAGSYRHIKGGMSLIENMRDATETIEELYYLVNCFCGEVQVAEAMKQFYRFKRKECDPDDPDKSAEGYAEAYLDTQKVMEK